MNKGHHFALYNKRKLAILSKDYTEANKLSLKLTLISKNVFGEKSLQYLTALREISKVHTSTAQYLEGYRVLQK